MCILANLPALFYFGYPATKVTDSMLQELCMHMDCLLAKNRLDKTSSRQMTVS